MNSISVYGYHSEMLASFDAMLSAEEPSKAPHVLPEILPSTHTPTACLLLDLPYELRAEIYNYVMPMTITRPIFGVTWRRATAPIWATNRKIYRECIGMLYSDCTFDIDVRVDGVTFYYQYPDRQSTSRRTYNFPDIIPARNIDLLQKIHVYVNEIDSYAGMVKYNYKNPAGLDIAVGVQVQKLCDVLRTLPEIRELQITYSAHSQESARLMPYILEPFRILKNTKTVTFIGFDCFEPSYATQLLNRLTNAYTRNSILSLPSEIRAEIYRHVLPYSTCSEVNGIREVVWHPGDAAIMRTCRSIYEETNHLLYGLSEFEFTWMLS